MGVVIVAAGLRSLQPLLPHQGARLELLSCMHLPQHCPLHPHQLPPSPSRLLGCRPLQSAILGYGLFQGLGTAGLLSRHLNAAENVIVQTTAGVMTGAGLDDTTLQPVLCCKVVRRQPNKCKLPDNATQHFPVQLHTTSIPASYSVAPVQCLCPPPFSACSRHCHHAPSCRFGRHHTCPGPPDP